MQLRELLPREHIVAPLEATRLFEAIGLLLDRLVGLGAVPRPDALSTIREETGLRGAVAVGDDVALPHFRTDAVDEIVLALGVAPRPLDPGATGLDARPRVVALLLAPVETAPLYLQTISTLVRFFGDDARLDRLLAARTPDEVLGLVTEADPRIQPHLTVRDLMAPFTTSLVPDATLADAVRLLVETGEASIAVVGETGEVLGVVGEREAMRALFPKVPRAGDQQDAALAEALREIRVRDVMTRSVLCVSEDIGLEEVATMLINKDVADLPVVSGGKLSGVLRRKDIIRKLFGRSS